MAAVGLHALAANIFKLEAPGQFVLLGILMLATSGLAARLLPQHLLRLVALAIARTRYSVNSIGELPLRAAPWSSATTSAMWILSFSPWLRLG